MWVIVDNAVSFVTNQKLISTCLANNLPARILTWIKRSIFREQKIRWNFPLNPTQYAGLKFLFFSPTKLLESLVNRVIGDEHSVLMKWVRYEQKSRLQYQLQCRLRWPQSNVPLAMPHLLNAFVFQFSTVEWTREGEKSAKIENEKVFSYKAWIKLTLMFIQQIAGKNSRNPERKNISSCKFVGSWFVLSSVLSIDSVDHFEELLCNFGQFFSSLGDTQQVLDRESIFSC